MIVVVNGVSHDDADGDGDVGADADAGVVADADVVAVAAHPAFRHGDSQTTALRSARRL